MIALRRWARPLVAACLLVASAPAAAAPKPKKKPPPTATPDAAPAHPATPAPSPIGADGRLEVTVIEVAGTRAYLQPGATAGVRYGGNAVFRGKTYPILESSDSFAVIDTRDGPLREDEKGRATVVAAGAEVTAPLAKPRPLDQWQHGWTPEEPPADSQNPAFVPLGTGEEGNRRYDVRVDIAGGASIPLPGQLGYPIYSGTLTARIHAEPFAAPLRFDFDGSVQGWIASDLASRVGGTTRSLVFVRELLLSYGTPMGFNGGIGRMRYAASTVGALDGLRVATNLGDGFSIGAFGGLLPNPLSGAPSTDAERFGIEARFSRQDLPLRPEAALVAQGSVFQGAPDERRLSGTVSLFPGPSRVGGYFELSNFDPNNPWGAAPVTLTAAGVEQSLRFGGFELGARFDARTPEMSRWLSSYLPASWFCVTVPSNVPAFAASEPCDGSVSLRASGEIEASFTQERYSLSLGALTVKDLAESDAADSVGAFVSARVVRIAKLLRLEAAGNFSRGTYLDMYGGTAGPGVTLFGDALDITAYYRLALLQYRSVDTTAAQNGIGTTIALFPSAQVFFTFQGEAILGDDVSALTMFGTATWRPRL